MDRLRKKYAGKRRRLLWACLMFLVTVTVCGCGSVMIQSAGATGAGRSPAAESEIFSAGENSSFAVHFIDVGQADAALVLCDGESMLIDGGNTEDSSLIYAYLKKLDLNALDYIVCTHGHEDHVGGLSGALNFATVKTALAPVTEYDSAAFRNFKKYLEAQGKSITVPKDGDTWKLGSADVSVLGPVSEAKDANNTSIVLRIVYGGTSFLFTGDAEREEEQEILESGVPLKSTVLKVGHHGSDTSTSYPFLREIMPEYAVISVGKGNSYGHPTENTLSRLRDAGAKVFRTDMQGDIICTSDGKEVSFETEKNADEDTVASVGPNSVETQTTYILNTNTMKFHLPSCTSAGKISEGNKESFGGDREELISQGYSPCGKCRP